MTEVLSHSGTALPAHQAHASGPNSIRVHDTTSIVPHGLTLQGTGGAIQGVGLLEPCSPDTSIEEMSERLSRDGVVWVKGLLDPALIKKFRGDYLSMVNQGTNMLKPGTDPVDGIFSGGDWRDFLLPGAVRVAAGLSDTGRFVENAILSHRSSTYLEFKDKVGMALEPFVGRLCGFNEPWCLPRSLLRCAVPGGETTPVHYDQIFLRAGPPTSVTAWVPIGDVELEGGGLIYLDKSGNIGRQYEEDFSRTNAGLSDEDRISAFNKNMSAGGWLDRNASQFGLNWNKRWLVGKYEAGDVVFHTPYAIHAGAKNESPDDRIRVSTDLRFVDKSKPYDKRWTVTAYDENDPNLARKIVSGKSINID